MSLYLIHFSQRYHHAGHYLGYSRNAPRRFEHHCAGRGRAKLVEAVLAAGIGLRLAWVLPGSRLDERALKNLKEGPRLCPLCNGPGAIKKARAAIARSRARTPQEDCRSSLTSQMKHTTLGRENNTRRGAGHE